MTNAEKFQKVFGYYATEMWAKPEKEFFEWINSEAIELEQEPVKHGAKMDKEREYAERGGECMPLYYFARADQMTDHNFTDDVAITYAQDKAEAIKKFSKLYDDIKDDEVNAVSWGHNNGVAILTDY